MFVVTANIEYTGPVPKIAQRKINEVLRDGHHKTAQTFHKEQLPIRFTERAFYFLQFKPRSKKYERQKIKNKGHRDPLKFSGESERLSKIEDIRATATKKRARARIILASRGLNRRNRRSEIDMRDEVTRVSPREVPKIEKDLHENIMQGFSKLEAERLTKEISVGAFV